MWSSGGAPPLPPGRPPELAQRQQQVVPASLSVQPLWQNGVQLREHLRELVERAALLKAVAAELESFELLQSKRNTPSTQSDAASNSEFDSEKHESTSLRAVAREDSGDTPPVDGLLTGSSHLIFNKVATPDEQAGTSSGNLLGPEQVIPRRELLAAVQTSGLTETQALAAAVELQNEVKDLLAPLQGALGAPGGWEHVAAIARLRSKREKIERNRRRRKRKRQQIAEANRNEQERIEEADRKVDEWRAREIAKSLARSKMERMKVVAEKKAKEERSRIEAELEMVLMVEKLQELRALRIQKLKKQGRFFPDEDDKFMERVRAAVEEEERQAVAAADTRAAAVAIASVAEAAKSTGLGSTLFRADIDELLEDQSYTFGARSSNAVVMGSADIKVQVDEVGNASRNEQVAEKEQVAAVQEAYRLPTEFYHFYYGSQVDLGTLVEVRRAWDAFLMPGGSRIPGHWIEAPPPADSTWASYLMKPTSKVVVASNSKATSRVKERKMK